MPDESGMNTLDPQYFLRKSYVLDRFVKKMDPILMFSENFFPRVRSDSPSYMYFEDTNSNLGDSLRKDPAAQTSLARFPRVKVSSVTQQFGKLTRYGFAIAFDEDIVLYPEFIDMTQRALDRVAVYMASKINDAMASSLLGAAWNSAISDSSTVGPRVVTAGNDWSGSSGTPIADINSLRRIIMEQNTVAAYNLSDVWITPKIGEALLNYLIGDNNKAAVWIKDPLLFNTFEIPQLLGLKVHLVNKVGTNQLTVSASGQKEAVLGLDAANPALTTYFASNPRYTGDFVQVHNWLDDETGELVYKFQVMFGNAKLDPLSVGLINTKIAS